MVVASSTRLKQIVRPNLLFLPIWIVAVRFQKLGMAPAKGGFPGGHPAQTAHGGTGEPSGNAYHAQTSRPFERTERSGLWDYRPAQTSRRCSASVLAAARRSTREAEEDVGKDRMAVRLALQSQITSALIISMRHLPNRARPKVLDAI